MANIKTESIVQSYIITLSPEEAAKLAYLLRAGILAEVSDTLVPSLLASLLQHKKELDQELDRVWLTNRRLFDTTAAFAQRR